MPSASTSPPQANKPLSQAPGRRTDTVHADQAFSASAHDHSSPHTHGTSQGSLMLHAKGLAHDHSLPPRHGRGLTGLQVEISPVLAGVWARVLTALGLLGLLWLAIFWAFAGNV